MKRKEQVERFERIVEEVYGEEREDDSGEDYF